MNRVSIVELIAKIAEAERLQERRKRYMYRLQLSYRKHRQRLSSLRVDLFWLKRQQRRQP